MALGLFVIRCRRVTRRMGQQLFSPRSGHRLFQVMRGCGANGVWKELAGCSFGTNCRKKEESERFFGGNGAALSRAALLLHLRGR
ncbi:MAG TPA: hypothetical protein VNX25_08145 [Verrucomicrobiae bacterium]|nr:hypothetical protein [Verrucomicrobiae bacterium]